MIPLALVLATLQEPKRVDSLTGDIRFHRDFESKTLGNKRDIAVYLPPGYEKSADRYPVLYMHDGQNCFSGLTSFIPNKEWRADEAAEALIKAKAIDPIIIVAVANGQIERGNEYLPSRFKMGENEVGGKADAYGKFLIEEVKAFVDKTYRTKPKENSLAGSSFGGVITLYLGMRHQSVFRNLGILSPSVWINGKEPLNWVNDLKRPTGQKVWVDIGTLEGTKGPQDAIELAETFRSKGWKDQKDLFFYLDGYAEHNEDAWARRFPTMLRWFYGR